MKRPMVYYCVAFICGILVIDYTSGKLGLISLYTLVLVCISLIIVFVLYKPLNKFNKITVSIDRKLVFILSGVVLFYFSGCISMFATKNSIYYKFDELTNKEVVINGFVCNEAEIKADRIEFILETSFLEQEAGFEWNKSRNVGKILVKVYYKEVNSLDELLLRAKELPKYGQGVTIKATVKQPRGMSNPKSFDYKKYLAGKRVSAYVSVSPEHIKTTSEAKTNLFIKLGYFLRNRIVTVVEKTMPKQQASLLNGMLIGYRDSMEDVVEVSFSEAGLTHIMAVSGANVAFIVLPLLFVFKKLRISRLKSNLIVIFFVILFAFTTGLDASVLRAATMAVIILAGRIMIRETDIYTSIAFSAIFLLFLNPFYIFNIGFLLSYGATLGLVLLYTPIKQLISWRGMPKTIIDTIACTLAAQLGVLPITVYYFNKISLISILSNLLVVPLTGIITIIGFIVAIVGQVWMMGAQIIAYINCTLVSFVLWVVKISADVPFATVSVITPSLIAIVVYYLFLALLLLFLKKAIIKKRFVWYSFMLLCILAIGFVKSVFPGELKVVFADVGQGDSIIIKTHYGKTVLIDGGGIMNWGKESDIDIGKRTVIPLLFDLGVSRLDAVVCTHAHYDHIGGLYSTLENYKVKELFLGRDLSIEDELNTSVLLKERYDPYVRLKSIAREKGVGVKYIDSSKIIRLDNKTYLEVLNPISNISSNTNSISMTTKNENDKSIVFRLVYKNTEILFCGDIGSEVEDELLQSGRDIRADVIKIAHHGADTSSQIEFLKEVAPKAAIISVGKNNFGHPAQGVLDRLEDINCEVYRTDIGGAVTLISNGNRVKVKAELE